MRHLIVFIIASVIPTLGYFFAFCSEMSTECINYVCGGIGIVGVLYLIDIIKCWIKPIKRDWILVRGKFLRIVVCLALYMPFIVSLILLLYDGKDLNKHLVYGDNMYVQEADTLLISKNDSLVNIEDLQNYSELHKWEIIGCKNDSILVCVNNYDAEPSYISGISDEPHILWTIYYHYVDPGNQHMASSKFGRGIAAIIAILGVLLLNGLFISTLINYFDGRKERWQNGEIRYGWFSLLRRKYAVVIGANSIAPIVIRDLLNGNGEQEVDYVILLTNGDAQDVRERIESYIKKNDARRLIVYNGQLDAIEEIYSLRLRKATEIYILGENTDEEKSSSYHDTQNMKCVHNIASYLTDKLVDRKIVCRVMFEYQTTYSVFQASDISQNIKDHLVFIPFSTYENWAQRVLVTGKYEEVVQKVLPMQRRTDFKKTWLNGVLYTTINRILGRMSKNNDDKRIIEYKPLDGNGICAQSGNHVHFVIVGMSKMGVAMAIQAAQIAHFPNFKVGDGKNRTRITIIDPNVDTEMNFFKGRFQNLFALSRNRYIDATDEANELNPKWVDSIEDNNSPYHHLRPNFIDIEWEFVKGNLEHPNVMKFLESVADRVSNENSILTIAICLPLSHEAIAASLYMPSVIYDVANQILVYQREASDIVYNLYYEEKDDKGHIDKRYAKLRPFGMEAGHFTMDKALYYKAQLCNYVYSMIFNNDILNEKIADEILSIECASDRKRMKPVRDDWKKLKISNKWSNKYLANSFGVKLRSINCITANYVFNYDVNYSAMIENEPEMAECEHNRWNVQQLLMGFRPYNASEEKELEALEKEDSKVYKANKKGGAEKAHIDIRSYEGLSKVEKDVQEYDKLLNKSIPAILAIVERAELHHNL